MYDHRGQDLCKRVGESAGKGERQNYVVHKQVNDDAVKQAGDDGPLHEEFDLAACGIEDGACYRRDQEMEGQTHTRGCKTAVIGIGTKECAGDSLQDPNWTTAVMESAIDECSRNVQDSGYQTTQEDYLISLWLSR